MTLMAETESSDTQTAQTAIAEETPQYDLSGTPDWAKTLEVDDAIKADPSLRPIKDIANLTKSYVNAQKLIGADKIVVPGKHATEEDWRGIYQKLGLPDNLEKYDLGVKVKESDDSFDSDFFNGYREQAYKLGILPKQAKELYDWHEQIMGDALKTQETKLEEKKAEAISSLRKEWGEAFDGKVRLAREAVKQLGGEELANYLEKTGLGDDTILVQVFAKMGEMYKEDGIIGEGTGKIGQTRDEIQEKVNNILADIKNPYYDRSHPNHNNAVKEMQSLMSKLY